MMSHTVSVVGRVLHPPGQCASKSSQGRQYDDPMSIICPNVMFAVQLGCDSTSLISGSYIAFSVFSAWGRPRDGVQA